MLDKPPRKKSVNLSIDAKLAAEAKEFGTNMSALLENALIKEGAAPIEWANTTKNTNWLKRTPMSAGQKRTTQTTTATRTTSTPIKITSFFGNLECHLRCAV